MKFTTISRRVAATGAATALAAGAVVGLTTTAAHAEPVVTNTYSCTAAGQTFPVGLTTNAPGIEGFPQINAGADLPGSLLSVTNTFTIPGAVYAFMSQAGVQTVSAPTYSGTFGATLINVTGVSVTLAGMTQNPDGSYSSDSTDADGDPVEGTGLNSAFTVPVAGEYDIVSPTTLDMVATTASGGEIPVSCTIADGTTAGAYHHIVVFKNATETTGRATKKSFQVGRKAKVAAAVTGGTQLLGDKVLLKKGTKTLDSALLAADGTATLVTKKLPVGKNKVKVVYKSTGYNNGSKSEIVIVKVVR